MWKGNMILDKMTQYHKDLIPPIYKFNVIPMETVMVFLPVIKIC